MADAVCEVELRVTLVEGVYVVVLVLVRLVDVVNDVLVVRVFVFICEGAKSVIRSRK